MSSYCSIDDLFVHGLPDTALDGIDVSKVEKLLEAASRKIDSYLRGRGYTVPLSDWGTDVTQCCAAIAAWDVLRHLRGVSPDDPGHQALVKAQLEALSWLRDVAKGVANFDLGESGNARRTTGVARFIGIDTCGDRGW